MSRIGDLSERIQLQSALDVSDGAGGWVRSWPNLASVWADVRPASATHGTRIGGTTTRRFIKIFVRNRDDLLLPLRVVWNGSNLDVLAVRSAKNGRTELECEEVLQ